MNFISDARIQAGTGDRTSAGRATRRLRGSTRRGTVKSVSEAQKDLRGLLELLGVCAAITVMNGGSAGMVDGYAVGVGDGHNRGAEGKRMICTSRGLLGLLGSLQVNRS